MIRLTTEQAQQIEVELKYARNVCADNNWSTEGPDEALAMIYMARAQEQAEQEPVAWYDKIKGMEVSVDVSTGEDDDYHRIFGRVDGVMLQSCGAQEDTILVIEDSRNFAAPVQQVDLTDEEVEDVCCRLWSGGWRKKAMNDFARAVIAADREKNK